MKSQLPFITVVMPVRNEELFIAEILNDLLIQDYPRDRYEIIVADGQSTDSTRRIVKEIAQSHPQVMLLPNPGLVSASGRNIGFQNGKGDFFLVVDGHCKIKHTQLLANLVDCFQRSNAQCLGRPQPFVVPEEPTLQKAIALARSSRLGHSPESFIHSNKEAFVSPVSVGCAYKREVFDRIGFVDHTFRACEDVEFNYRVEKAGFNTFFSPKTAVYYYPRENLKGLFQQLLRYGEGRIRFTFKHPETINLNMFLPQIFIAGVFLGPILALMTKTFLFFYLPFFVIYFGIVTIQSIRLSLGSGVSFILKLILVFFVIHSSLGIGLMKGGLRCLFNRFFDNRFRQAKKKA